MAEDNTTNDIDLSTPYGQAYKSWKDANESLANMVQEGKTGAEVQELTKQVGVLRDTLLSEYPDRAKKDIKKEEKRLEKVAKMLKFASKEKKMAATATSQEDQDKKRAERTQKLKDSMEASATYDIPTPKGEKKDTECELPSAFNPKFVEACWYEWWEKQGLFKPESARQEGDPFVIVIPPPNVTGQLHLGHALTNTIQDTLVRWHRMKGQASLWVPGVDHAGIATQVVVEKQLMKKEGKSRHDYGREEFIKRVWEWKKDYGDRICRQLRRLGSSLDWDREVFTMDEPRSAAVKEAFLRMYKKGIVYRDVRLVNWCCALRTAISDIEVDRQELTGRTAIKVPGEKKPVDFGVLHSFAYPVEDGGELVVATTRIETMLGDTAIAIHPDDPRYTHLHGKFVIHPLQNRKIPIICDSKLVDMSFGTGAVKVTPAHDPNDFDTGKRHGLKFINIITDDGLINENGAPFTGLKRFEAREAVLEAIKSKGLFRGVSDNPMTVPICSRSGDVIEPMVKPQWFVKCDDMAARAVQAVKDGSLVIVPESHTSTWFHYLNNIRDWCVSRQLWWGHRIPAYYVTFLNEKHAFDSDMERWIVANSEEEAREIATKKFNKDKSEIVLKQDPDVLDTWFSSGLFPFSVFNWPNDTCDLRKYFPTTLLETGHDILFFWVARMVMMSLCLMDCLPFKYVYLHAMVRDAHGKKMSKSSGNVIDPLDVMEGISLDGLYERLKSSFLPAEEMERAKKVQKADFPNGIIECGTDALRFALLAYTSQGRDVNLDINRVIGYRQFCNKLWNAVKFAMMRLGKDFEPDLELLSKITSQKLVLTDQWILSRLSASVETANKALDTYAFSDYTTAIFNFWLYDLCDVHLENIKPILTRGGDDSVITKNVLWLCLDVALRLTHPIMPFITEELWQRLPGRAKLAKATIDSIMMSHYPVPANVGEYVQLSALSLNNPVAEESMACVMEIVKSARSMRTTYHLPNNAKPNVFVIPQTANTVKILSDSTVMEYICTLIKGGQVKVLSETDVKPTGCVVSVVAGVSIYLHVADYLDVEKEIAKLEDKIGQTNLSIQSMEVEQTLAEFSKRPEEVQAAHGEKLEATKKELVVATEALNMLKAMGK